LLIANRGEIACRIMRTAKRMGLRTIAVYSDADAAARHVRDADEAVRIGPSSARESYLDIGRILEAARLTGAEAVHPGYGFLSESAAFATRCVEAGLVFVGPSAAMIEAMGSKARAKVLMEKAGVPMVPGYHGDAQDEAVLTNAAQAIGFPVLVKASAGGGGRGMRIVREADELGAAVTSAKREAKAAFGDDHVLIEKYIASPRHIEVQVIGDAHGHLVSLHERECTLQRRHQKVIEEAPSPTLTAAQRDAICVAARQAAEAVNYVGAGTVEFVSNGREFFFIEMNTRLQVEHPVTEMITGIDLVEWQLRVAAGEPLPLRQEEIPLHGHAIEARVYAEDPAQGFMPSVGRIAGWHPPLTEAGRVRIDTGFGAGDVVSPYYDAMLAKLIIWSEDRAQALARSVAELAVFDVHGVTTNVPFLAALLGHPQVAANAIDTGFIERELEILARPMAAPGVVEFAVAVAGILRDEARALSVCDKQSPWLNAGWLVAGARHRTFRLRDAAGQDHALTLRYGRNGMVLAHGEERTPLRFHDVDGNVLDVFLGARKLRVGVACDGRHIAVRTPNGRFQMIWHDPFGGEHDSDAGSGSIVAPLPGTVVALLAEVGDTLEKGAPILTLEAMKMEHTLRAPAAGVLRKLSCAVGAFVQEGAELAELEAHEAVHD
jgi:3-methylcrotonyl-CoA carboxylase alpha subunit